MYDVSQIGLYERYASLEAHKYCSFKLIISGK